MDLKHSDLHAAVVDELLQYMINVCSVAVSTCKIVSAESSCSLAVVIKFPEILVSVRKNHATMCKNIQHVFI